jgi:hypothetical protein
MWDLQGIQNEKTRDMAVRCHFKSVHKDLKFFHNSGHNNVLDIVFRNENTPQTSTRRQVPVS